MPTAVTITEDVLIKDKNAVISISFYLYRDRYSYILFSECFDAT